MTLFNGRRYEGVPGADDFRVIEFREHGIPVITPEETVGTAKDPDTKPTRELLGSSSLVDIAQLQYRASSPIMALVLTLIAVPLSRLRPRQGRYARVGFAIVVYFVYSNLLSAAKVWVEKGTCLRRSAYGGCTSCYWHSASIWSFASENHVNTLDRYLYRTVIVYTLPWRWGCS